MEHDVSRISCSFVRISPKTIKGGFDVTQVLACVACHPDDEVLSAGALLLKARDAGFSIHLVWLTRGEGSASHSAANRSSEAQNVAMQLKAEPHWLELIDGQVQEREAIVQVESVLKEIKPNVVVWPFGSDASQHQDHRTLHCALVNIAQRWPYKSCAWLVGQPPVFHDPSFRPTLWLSYNKSMMEELIQLMGYYKSEMTKRFASPASLQHRAGYYADQGVVDSDYAQPFVIQKGAPPLLLFPTSDERMGEALSESSQVPQGSKRDSPCTRNGFSPAGIYAIGDSPQSNTSAEASSMTSALPLIYSAPNLMCPIVADALWTATDPKSDGRKWLDNGNIWHKTLQSILDHDIDALIAYEDIRGDDQDGMARVTQTVGRLSDRTATFWRSIAETLKQKEANHLLDGLMGNITRGALYYDKTYANLFNPTSSAQEKFKSLFSIVLAVVPQGNRLHVLCPDPASGTVVSPYPAMDQASFSAYYDYVTWEFARHTYTNKREDPQWGLRSMSCSAFPRLTALRSGQDHPVAIVLGCRSGIQFPILSNADHSVVGMVAVYSALPDYFSLFHNIPHTEAALLVTLDNYKELWGSPDAVDTIMGDSPFKEIVKGIIGPFLVREKDSVQARIVDHLTLMSAEWEKQSRQKSLSQKAVVLVTKKDRTSEWLAQALLLVQDHPDWSITAIAQKVGKHTSTLTRSKVFKAALELARRSKNDLPAGFLVVNPDTGQRDVEAVAAATASSSNAASEADRGQRIPGSNLYREYCAECREQIRVSKAQVGNNPCCKNCSE
jgi:LmbE family N-acetylglucosaminyl deacetylase